MVVWLTSVVFMHFLNCYRQECIRSAGGIKIKPERTQSFKFRVNNSILGVWKLHLILKAFLHHEGKHYLLSDYKIVSGKVVVMQHQASCWQLQLIQGRQCRKDERQHPSLYIVLCLMGNCSLGISFVTA